MVASSPDNAPAIEVDEQQAVLVFGDRRYRVRGLAKNLSPEVLKVNVLVVRGEQMHVDTLDLYAAKARAVFVAQAASALEIEADVIARDVAKLLLALEDLQAIGAAMSDGTWGIPADLAAGALSDLARLHVTFESTERLAAIRPWVMATPPMSSRPSSVKVGASLNAGTRSGDVTARPLTSPPRTCSPAELNVWIARLTWPPSTAVMLSPALRNGTC